VPIFSQEIAENGDQNAIKLTQSIKVIFYIKYCQKLANFGIVTLNTTFIKKQYNIRF
jgi:hypothetical protein